MLKSVRAWAGGPRTLSVRVRADGNPVSAPGAHRHGTLPDANRRG